MLMKTIKYNNQEEPEFYNSLNKILMQLHNNRKKIHQAQKYRQYNRSSRNNRIRNQFPVQAY